MHSECLDLRFRIRAGWLVASLAAAVLPPAQALAQFDFGTSVGAPSFGGPSGGQVAVEAEFSAPQGGKPAVLFVTAEVSGDFHVYAVDQGVLTDGGGPKATVIEATMPAGVTLAGPWRPIKPPETHVDDLIWVGLELREHAGKVTWYAPLAWPEGLDPQSAQIEGTVEGQACNPQTCVPFTKTFSAAVGDGFDVTIPVETAAVESAPYYEPTPQTETPAAPAKIAELAPGAEPVDLTSSDSFLTILGLAFLGGLILNVMPCVLPVIGLKVFAFIEQSGESRSKIFLLNFWYALGVISVFMLLAVLSIVFQLGWGQLFQYAEFNIAMAAVIFTMGLSFLGVWEIPIPGFIGTSKVTDIGQREGYEGAFAKGTITTLLATPCTGPFMGTALVGVLNRPPVEILSVFFSIGLGMASPYLLIGAFPQLVRFLPKPGEWMNTFKQLMGFFLIGTVVYLLTLLKPYYVVPTVAFLFGLWMACWWIGRVPVTSTGNKRWQALGEGALAASIIGILAFYMLTPVLAQRQQREAYRLAETKLEELLETSGGEFMVSDEPWQPYSERKLQWLLERGKTVVIDFTADWCPTCKVMEKTVLKTDAMGSVFEANDIYTLVADWTHRDTSTEVTAKLNELRAQQIPLLAIYSGSRPDAAPILVPGTYTISSLTEKLAEAGPSVVVDTERAIARPPVDTGFGVPIPEQRRY
ncbi:MAG: thioredoxin family protein [Planctomycetota bacterium]